MSNSKCLQLQAKQEVSVYIPNMSSMTQLQNIYSWRDISAL